MPCIIGSKFDGNIDNKLKTDYVWIPNGTANYGSGRRYGRALHSGTLGLLLDVPHVANKSHGWTLEMYIKDLNNYVGPLFGFGNSGNMFAIDMNGNFRLVYWGGDYNCRTASDMGGWHHFVVTNDWSTHRLFIDGVNVVTRGSGRGGWNYFMLFQRPGYGLSGNTAALVDEIKFYDYIKYTENFTPPKELLPEYPIYQHDQSIYIEEET